MATTACSLAAVLLESFIGFFCFFIGNTRKYCWYEFLSYAKTYLGDNDLFNHRINPLAVIFGESSNFLNFIKDEFKLKCSPDPLFFRFFERIILYLYIL